MTRSSSPSLRGLWLAAALALVAAACGDGQRDRVRVGGKGSTEQRILSKLAAVLLDDRGFDVDDSTAEFGLDLAMARSAIEGGDIDVYFEYTGTALTVFLNETDPVRLSDPNNVDLLRQLDAANGVVWGEASSSNTTFAFAVRAADAATAPLTNLTELFAEVTANPGVYRWLVGSHQLFRPDGIHVMSEHYGETVAEADIIVTDEDQGMDRYEWLQNRELPPGEKPIVEVNSTDGEIPAFDLVVLGDDQRFYPYYAVAASMLDRFNDANPDVLPILNEITARLTTEELIALNAQALESGDIEAVARFWLDDKGLIGIPSDM